VRKKQRHFTVDGVLETLRRTGFRVTGGRRRILDILFEATRPMSLEEIRSAANRNAKAPDYATVFRTIALLEKLGFVHKVNLQRACSFFELQDPSKHYDHLVCTSCGRVVVLAEHCPLGPFEKQIGRRHRFREIHHSLEFFGKCEQC
jgi:Fe2+ or Zn2+ uptake regulation protein